MTKLDDAFDDLEFNVTEQLKKSSYLAEQRKVATGVTDGTAQRELVRDLTENLRAIQTVDVEILRNDVLEEVASEIAKLPFGDTASSFAQFVRAMKR
jgi:hypothetical protein